MASYFHIWMLPRHFHVVFDVASCLLNLSIMISCARIYTPISLHLKSISFHPSAPPLRPLKYLRTLKYLRPSAPPSKKGSIGPYITTMEKSIKNLPNLSIPFLGKTLTLVAVCKDLGLSLDASLTFDDHISSLTLTLTSSLYQINIVLTKTVCWT